MSYHYMTQPLPNYMSLFFHNLPMWMHKLESLSTFVFEIITPLGMLLGWWGRLVGCVGTVLMQIFIHGSGNYGYFSLMSAVLAIALLVRPHR